MLFNLFRWLTRFIFVGWITSFTLAQANTSTPYYKISGVTASLESKLCTQLRSIESQTTPKPIAYHIKERERILKEALQALGYFKATILSTSDNQKQCTIHAINTGPLLPITHIAFQMLGEGQTNTTLQKGAQNLLASTERIMSSECYQTLKNNLYHLATEAGYLDTGWHESQVTIDLEAYTAKATLILDTKKRYTVQSVSISSDKYCLDLKFLDRYLNIHTGDAYQIKHLLNSQVSLEKSGYFDEVRLSNLSHHSATDIPLQLLLKYAPRYYTHISGGLNNYSAYLTAQGLVRYLNPSGHQLSGLIRISNRFSLLARYRIPGPQPTTQHHRFQVEYQSQLNLKNINFQHPLGKITYAWVQRYGFIQWAPSLRLHLEKNQTSGSDYLGCILSNFLHYEKPSLSLQRLEYNLTSEIQGALPLFSDSFVSIKTKGRCTARLNKKGRPHYLITYGDISTFLLPPPTEVDLPASLQFYAGGYGCPRGHKKYKLGSLGLSGGVELRRHLTGLLYANLFAESSYGIESQTKSSCGGGVCLWYPSIGSIAITGVYKFQGNGPSKSRCRILINVQTATEDLPS